MHDIIDRFDGDYRFLSNFHNCPVEYQGITYANSEAAFQAAKCTSDAEKMRFARMSPGTAKHEGRHVQLRPDWEEVKDTVMLEIVRAKFTQNQGLAEKLLDTGDAELIEGNYWKDFYWGVCYGKGQNKLGKILMQVRREIREGKDKASA